MEEAEPQQPDEASQGYDSEIIILEMAASGWADYIGPDVSEASLEEIVDHALQFSKGYIFKYFIGCCAKIVLDLENQEEISDDLGDKVYELTGRISDRMVELDYNSCSYEKEVRTAFLTILQVMTEHLAELDLVNSNLITDVADYQVMGPASSTPAPTGQMYWPLGPAFWEVTEDDR